VAILAQSLDLPLLICDMPELLKLRSRNFIIVDGEVGNIYLNPGPEIIDKFKSQQELKRHSHSQTPERMTHTRDGQRVRLMANINLLSEVRLASELKAEGIGLYRSEFPFLIRTSFPTENEQYQIYRRLLADAPGAEVTFRTLDIGGDKLLSYSDLETGDNPALGLRSIRFSLKHTGIFKQQLRAILRAAADFDNLRIMFPLISSLEEFRSARNLVDECRAELGLGGVPHHAAPQVGMMIELPAVVEIMPELSREADFFCIGTNDFVQYLLGVDRTNAQMASYYRPGHPAVLRAIKRISDACLASGKELSVCGEMAHDPDFIEFFVGLGITKLSLDPRQLYATQRIIAAIDSSAARAHAAAMLKG
jgi:phosphotransferase system enzyme I (PtsP)